MAMSTRIDVRRKVLKNITTIHNLLCLHKSHRIIPTASPMLGHKGCWLSGCIRLSAVPFPLFSTTVFEDPHSDTLLSVSLRLLMSSVSVVLVKNNGSESNTEWPLSALALFLSWRTEVQAGHKI